MRKALVTGSTKGIGLAISRLLVEHGYFVYVNYAHDDAAVSSLGLDAARHRLIKADLSGKPGADLLTDVILSEGVRLDCLVLNAGATCRKLFGQISCDDWNYVMNMNVNMPFYIIQKLRDAIADHGSVLFVGSGMGVHPHATSLPYGVSKAAAHMLARCLVKEMAERRIRVNVVAPGFIDTDWQQNKPQWLRERIEGKTALARFGTSEEIAIMCHALIENTYVNGAVLSVDGGYDYI
ncbi:MAG: SDR family oxidoreductase [Clostridiales Family XIII bacterium]|jgi:NAD(P)-dependent dehydrogenase (short-subunit alcohol dehydrogenase family)|nr:SDR family oxidoreductase [Clostridiales Family XIII bacterium]